MKPQATPPPGKFYCVSRTVTEFTYHASLESAEAGYEAMRTEEEGLRGRYPTEGVELKLWKHYTGPPDVAGWQVASEHEFPAAPQTSGT